jgi:hypothetical protein
MKKPMRTRSPRNSAATCQCFCCKQTIKEVDGFRFDESILKMPKFRNAELKKAFIKMLQDDYTTMGVLCEECASEVAVDGRPAFVRVYAQGRVPFADAETPHSTPRPTNEHRAHKSQPDPVAFATAVLDNTHRAKHRKEEMPSGGFINYCDCCGDDDRGREVMMGVINQLGTGAWAMCPACFAKAKEELGDKLPELTFRQALCDVMKITRPRPVQPPAPPASKAKKPTRAPKPSKGAGEDISEVVPMPPAPPAPFVSNARRLDSIKSIYEALMEGDDRVRFGGTDKNSMLTLCTVHATQSRLCRTPKGANWEQMRSVIKDGKAFPFCPECAAQLTISGVRLEMTHKEAMQRIGAAINGNDGGGINRDRMEFADPTARVKKMSNARKRQLAAAEVERAELKKRFAAKLAAIDRQIADECAKLKPIQAMATTAEMELFGAQEDLRNKLNELDAMREANADSDMVQVMELEIAGLRGRIAVLEVDAAAANELLAEQQAEVDATVAKIQAIRDQVESDGPTALREPHIHQVRSTREERDGEKKPKGGKKPKGKKDKEKRDKGKNGGSKAA